MFKTVLVCLDGSRLAEQILPHVAELVRQSDAKVTLLRVITPRAEAASPLARQPPLSAERGAEDYLEEAASSLAAAAVDVQCIALQGKPGEAIVRYARENRFDLIAMATHGRGGLQNTLFGSVAQHVLRESGIPLLLIRPRHG